MASAGWARRRQFAVLTLVALAVASLASPALARPGAQRAKDRYIALLVSSKMDKQHLSGLGVTDTTSARALDMYLEMLDPLKLYFTQGDVDKFAADRTKIDDEIRSGDVRVANRVIDVFLGRVAERTELGKKVVDAPHDVTVEESEARDQEEVEWAE